MDDKTIHIIILILYSLLETWMGKNKNKANSIPELIWNVSIGVFKWISSRQ